MDNELHHDLELLGIDIETEDGRREFRKTFEWANKQRHRCDKYTGYIVLIILGSMVTAAGSVFMQGIMPWLRKVGLVT